MSTSKYTRRSFLRGAALSAGAAVVAACAGEPEVVEKIVQETVVVEKVVEKEVTVLVEAEAKEEPTATPQPVARYAESPMLAERVSAGDLPPVEQRLPEEPEVAEIVEEDRPVWWQPRHGLPELVAHQSRSHGGRAPHHQELEGQR